MICNYCLLNVNIVNMSNFSYYVTKFQQISYITRSNLPKEIMELSGFPHTGVGDACYFPAAYIQKYLNDFTDHFNLRSHIKVSQIILFEKKKIIIIISL